MHELVNVVTDHVDARHKHEDTNTKCGQKAELLNVKAGGTYSKS